MSNLFVLFNVKLRKQQPPQRENNRIGNPALNIFIRHKHTDNHLSNHLLQLCLYLGRRDFVDHVEHVDPIDGVLKIDPSALNGKKVWIQLACAFHYGREDLDVIGVSFRKDIWIKRIQMHPFEGTKPPNTPMQDALLKKVGDQGHPFTFDIPVHLPCSVSLQPAPEDAGKPCGVDYEVKAYIANEEDETDEKAVKKDTCRLIIRKIQYAPSELAAGPKTDLNKQFITADKPIHVEASMEKELYYHGDPIPIKVKVNNETSKVVKKIKISIHQITDVLLYSADKYHKCVLNEEFADQINANSTFEKEYRVTPLLANNKEKRGLSLDGKLKDEDTNLASSTILLPNMDKQIQGLVVSYKIRVTLIMGGGLLGSLTLRFSILPLSFSNDICCY
uniref:Arrestin-C n=2 Tax=Cyprinus carpio TaxID=7962 RepID=A0A8C0YB96_CYPCA